jgi:hypothetical protein
MSQQPAGMQLYLCTSFLFTLVQGGALRHDGIRQHFGLPKMHQQYEAELAKEFMELKKLERKAQELRGNGPLLGVGVLAMGLETSFAGTHRPSTIIGSNPHGGPLLTEWGEGLAAVPMHKTTTPSVQMSKLVDNNDDDNTNDQEYNLYQDGPFIHGISAPRPDQGIQRRGNESLQPGRESNKEEPTTTTTTSHLLEGDEYMPIISNQVMEAANRGEFPAKQIQMARMTKKMDSKLDPKRFLARKKRKKPRTK